MPDFKQNNVSLRFVEAYNSLKEKRAFRSDAEFARTLNFTPQTINGVLHGRRDVSIEMLTRFFAAYKVRPSFIFNVSEPDLPENTALPAISGIDILNLYLNNIKPLLLRLERLQLAVQKLKLNNFKRLLPEETKIAHSSFAAFEVKLIQLLKNHHADEKQHSEYYNELSNYAEIFNQEYILFSCLLIEIVIDPSFKSEQLKDRFQKNDLKGREIRVSLKSKKQN